MQLWRMCIFQCLAGNRDRSRFAAFFVAKVFCCISPPCPLEAKADAAKFDVRFGTKEDSKATQAVSKLQHVMSPLTAYCMCCTLFAMNL